MVNVKERRLRIYASPQTLQYGDWRFQYALSSQQARNTWYNKIPLGIDVLVTHGPARGHVDGFDAPAVACVELLREVKRVKPVLHVCGHVHKARGAEVVDWGIV
jgi:Icc-related predicted phosphoesterase